jgi:hypothetical protein
MYVSRRHSIPLIFSLLFQGPEQSRIFDKFPRPEESGQPSYRESRFPALRYAGELLVGVITSGSATTREFADLQAWFLSLPIKAGGSKWFYGRAIRFGCVDLRLETG